MTALIELYANNASSTLASSILATDTTISIAPGTESAFPNPTVGTQYFRLTITGAVIPLQYYEICYVTARSSGNLTVLRGQEGTTARSWGLDDLCYVTVTAGASQNFMQNNFGIDTGTVNAYVINTPQNATAYYNGMPVTFTTLNANTNVAPTLNVNGFGATVIKTAHGSALVAGDVAANQVMQCFYNSADSTWRLQTPCASNVTEFVGTQFVRSVAGKTGVVTLDVNDVSGAAPIDSPTFTGTPTAPTPPNGDSSTKVATTAFVQANTNYIYLNTNADVRSAIYLVDTSGGTFTLTLPASPATGTIITFIDANANWYKTPWTLARNGNTIMQYAANLTVNVADQEFSIWYNGSDWRLV